MTLGAPARIGQWRRTVGVAAVVAAALAATALAATGTSGAQVAGFNKGTGAALAQSMRIDPVAGGLSFGIGVAESLAGHQNTVATAESRAVNTGVIGVTLGAEGCDGGDPTLAKEDQPQPVRTQSGAEGAEEGITNQDPRVPGVYRTVRATTAPFAETITESEGFEIPGVIAVGPTIARSTSGVFDGYREATATSDISSIVFAGGAVTMQGLHWEAIHRTGAGENIGGSFSIGSMTGPLGVPIPTDDIISALTQANQALAPFGFRFEPPAYHLDTTSSSTLATVDPMAIAMVPAPMRDSITQPVLSGAQPVRDELFAAFIEADCGTASGITVLDILLNATGPGGQLSLDLGGVQATTAAITLFSGLGQLSPLPPLSPPASLPAIVAGGGAARDSRPSPGVSIGPTPTPAGSISAAPVAPVRDETPIDDAIAAVADGERGGKMLAVGAGGLLALLAAAEGDRRKMRQAQRMIPLEA